MAPKPEQAFYFGFHRALKKQKNIIRDVATAFIELGGEGRMYALAGAKAAGFGLGQLTIRVHNLERNSKAAETNDLFASVEAFAKRVSKTKQSIQ